MLYYMLAGFMSATIICMYNGIQLLTGIWLVSVFLCVSVLFLLDKVFLEDLNEDDW